MDYYRRDSDGSSRHAMCQRLPAIIRGGRRSVAADSPRIILENKQPSDKTSGKGVRRDAHPFHCRSFAIFSSVIHRAKVTSRGSLELASSRWRGSLVRRLLKNPPAANDDGYSSLVAFLSFLRTWGYAGVHTRDVLDVYASFTRSSSDYYIAQPGFTLRRRHPP